MDENHTKKSELGSDIYIERETTERNRCIQARTKTEKSNRTDEILEQQLESLVGTLKAAKKQGKINFEGQMLLSPSHDNVVITMKAGL